MANAPRDQNQIPAILATSGTSAVPVLCDSSGNLLVSIVSSSTSGGLSVYSKLDLSNTKQTVKASSGKLYTVDFDNTANTAKTYVQIFDALAASVTVGTTAPTFSLVIPAGGAMDAAYMDGGITMATGIVIAATTTANGSTAPSSAIGVTIGYL